MYKCKHCGFVAYNEKIRYCLNSGCVNYCNPIDCSDGCKANEVPLTQEVSDMHQLGFATVPFQKFKEIMPPCQALAAGTVFAELDMPYTKKIIRRG